MTKSLRFYHLVSPRETRPKAVRGVDWGSEAIVIARTLYGSTRLLWCPGHTAWASLIDQKHYYPATLELERGPSVAADREVLHEGGKLSAKLLAEHVAKIALQFDAPWEQLADLLKTALKEKKTLVIHDVNRIETEEGKD